MANFQSFPLIQMDYQIKCYFERFGQVTAVETYQKKYANKCYALVEFESPETAAIILSSTEMNCIDGGVVEIKAADPCQQLDHHTRTKKLDLTKVSYKKGKALLQTYGSTAQSVIVARETTQFLANDYEFEILAMITQCCTTELKELTLHNFRFEKMLPKKINCGSSLGKLEKLSFIDCQIRKEVRDFLSSCVGLKVLRLERCTLHHNLSIWPKFGKLEELRLINFAAIESHHYLDGKDGLIALNPTLKKLSVRESPTKYFRSAINLLDTIEILDRTNRNLVELDLDLADYEGVDLVKSVRPLGRFKLLKILKFDLNFGLAAPLGAVLTENAIPIEHMQLSYGKIDAETVKKISQMKWLKVLELHHIEGMTDEHVIELAKGLGSRLEELKLRGATAVNLTTNGLTKVLSFASKLSLLTLKSETLTIDAADYQAMLEATQKRPKKNSLVIELTGAGGQVKVPGTILMKNSDCIFIDEKIGEVSDNDSYSDSNDSSDGDDNNSLKF